jgi:UDP:flavonoid glycosyltransferase YjiC (YdhE family)
VRILLGFAGGSGHFDPLVPLAVAARDRGHDVAFAARPWMVPRVVASGFAAIPAGSDEGLAPVTRPLLEIDPERELRDLRDGFGRWIARERARDLVRLGADWSPDVVVWEETDFGAALVAEQLGLPHASVLVTASGSFVRPEVMAPVLDDLRGELGLPPDPDAAMLSRFLVLSPVPPSFRDPAIPPGPTTRGYRTSAPTGDDRPSVTPAWACVLPDAPVVYVTLGTVFNHESGDLFERVLAGLDALRVNTLVTVGREIDPTRFGDRPSNVAIERFVPQADILPFVDLVVSHGGSGSVLGALAHGRPLVVVPIGADQPQNAARCAALGVGRVLDAVRTTPAELAGAVSAVLDDPSYRTAAGRLRDEIAELPEPEHGVALLERLVRDRRPIVEPGAAIPRHGRGEPLVP